jgi:hypothetical protein
MFRQAVKSATTSLARGGNGPFVPKLAFQHPTEWRPWARSIDIFRNTGSGLIRVA